MTVSLVCPPLQDWPTAIRHLRVVAGVTQEQLAGALGVTVSTVNRWENGRAYPMSVTRRVLVQFATTHGVSLQPYVDPVAPGYHTTTKGVSMVKALLAGAFVFLVTAAHAASSATFTVRQDSDCAAVASFDMLSAPITTAEPNPGPSSATVLASFANTPVCANGIAFSRTVAVVLAAGQVRFWMRNVASDGTLSGVSNSLDRSVPPSRPVAVDVSF